MNPARKMQRSASLKAEKQREKERRIRSKAEAVRLKAIQQRRETALQKTNWQRHLCTPKTTTALKVFLALTSIDTASNPLPLP